MSEADTVSEKSRPKRPQPKGGSRKGIPNKTTTQVKEALSAAFEGIGGVATLQTWARKEPTEFFKLWAKMLPAETKVDLSGDMTLNVTLKQYKS